MLSVREALDLLLGAAEPVAGEERISTFDADARVLAQDLISPFDVPRMRCTQMDGYAVRAADCAGASEAQPVQLPVVQRIPAGQVARALQPGTAARIFTGAMVPDGADAVVMQEQTTADGDQVLIRHAPPPGEWVRTIGEDIAHGATILSAGARLTPQALGLAASVGFAELPVRRRVRVATFFTGDELAMPGEPLRPGAIYNSNRFVLRAWLARLGCEVKDYGIVRDRREATIDALRAAALDADLIVTSGGMSVGDEDHVRPAVEAIGRLALWQIAVKPGKPLAFGEIGNALQRSGRAAYFIGLPGNPVSSFVTFLLFVRPFVRALQGCDPKTLEPVRRRMRADFDWSKPDRRQEYLRVRLNAEGGLDLYPSQSAAVLTSAVWADGMVENPPGQAIQRGDAVDFIAFADFLL